MRRVAATLLLMSLTVTVGFAQQTRPELTVATIMQDPDTWIGSAPSGGTWSEDGATLYFFWNPEGQFPADSLYKVGREGGTPAKVSPEERRSIRPTFDGWQHGTHTYDASFTRKVFAENGDLYLYNRTSGDLRQLTDTRTREGGPRFTPGGTGLVFTMENNLYHMDLGTGHMRQLTDLRSGTEREDRDRTDEQDQWLEAQQEHLFEYLRQQKAEREARDAARERETAATTQDDPPTYFFGNSFMQSLQIDPSGRFVSFLLNERGSTKNTIVQNYVTASGYAEDLNARPKVGVDGGMRELYLQDLERDTTYQVDLTKLPGAYDVIPHHRADEGVEPDSGKARTLYPSGPYWSGDGRYAVLVVRTYDNKDRWIVRLDPESGDLTVLHRDTDEAWIAGPGVGWFGGGGSVGWLPDNRGFYFQSEASGYSHLYVADLSSGRVRQLTDGAFEVFDPQVSRDGRTWFFTSSEESPFVRHAYRMPIGGGTRTKLTTMSGNNDVDLHPSEDLMAVRRSFSNQPPELYLQTPGSEPEQLTESTLPAWEAYPWRVPETVMIPASDGAEVPAHVFRPENPNGAAVLFVHGAGYLQNVHTWWSSYFREYMFHNLLVDQGYTVLNLDFRASSGYGRDWRTAIYRHMGGRDLQDYVDASRYVRSEYSIDPERVFIYGGSYGGFITLMALFTEPEHFGGGAALRSVTDWAHYNHSYTSNILNTPVTDSLAIARSSPIYFAEGLEDPLLIAHGVIDTNVQFQDVVRLAQRLIELGKEDWEMALYPIEGHGFTEPASWADEYRRILKLIHESVGPDAE